MFLIILALLNVVNAIDIVNMQTEYLNEPLGIDVVQPRFSYQITSTAALRGLSQKSYLINVYESSQKEPIWTSLDVATSNTHNIQYQGTPLKPGTKYSWTVRITSTGGVSQDSSVATFTTGITNWTGQFIGYNTSDQSIAPWFRKTFEMSGTSDTTSKSQAFLYVASVGFCEVTVNGQPVSDGVLLPSISYLPARVLYRTYEISHLLHVGDNNTIGLWASAGWGSYESFQFAQPSQYKRSPLVMAELQIAQQVIVSTDNTWEVRKSTTSHIGGWGKDPVTGLEGFGGDLVNNNLDVPGWDTPLVAIATPWEETATLYPLASNITISADVMEPTRKHSSVAPSSIDVDGNANGEIKGCGNVTITMKELFTGWFEINNLTAPQNETLRFYVSTTTGIASEFAMVDGLTIDASGTGNFRMRFSYHEIHYITIEGLTVPPSLKDVTGWRLSVALERKGAFKSSDALMNAIYDTTVNNYLGLTTGGQTVDCPHRERRGYGGDAHTSYQFALANFDVGAYFTKWARDFADVQMPDGDVPHTAPTVSGGGGPAWSGFVVTLPWQVYRTYGDTSLLASMYPTMQKQLSFYTTKTQVKDGMLHNWDPTTKWDFLGDWITPHGSEDNPTDPINILFNNCYLHYITSLAARIADLLEKPKDGIKYRQAASLLAANINAAYYNNSTGAFIDNLQTHLLMPLATGVVPVARQASVLKSLEAAIAETGGHLDTGLTGNYFMTKYFTENGRNDLMMGITNKTTFPSYGYFLEQGYTTWPEQWNVDKCCGQQQLSKMHGCYNAVGMWFVQGLAGIDIDYSNSDGYPFVIQAGVDAGGGLVSASGERASPSGLIQSSWLMKENVGFFHNVTIPGNGVAKVLIPAKDAADVLENGKKLSNDIKIIGMKVINSISYVEVGLGAGKYLFSSSWEKVK